MQKSCMNEQGKIQNKVVILSSGRRGSILERKLVNLIHLPIVKPSEKKTSQRISTLKGGHQCQLHINRRKGNIAYVVYIIE